VDDGVLTYRMKHVQKEGDKDTVEIPFGVCVWATGIGMRPITEKLRKHFAARTYFNLEKQISCK
jgi:NADH dehydrogenase FAD-containing subunit